MSVTFFPSIQPTATTVETTKPRYKEIKWDYENDIPIFKNGAPVIVEGKDAVFVWAWKALKTSRYRYEIYTWNFGNETEQLIGQPFTDELKVAEAARYVRDCLVVNPYILDVKSIQVAFSDGTLTVNCSLITVYGEVSIYV